MSVPGFGAVTTVDLVAAYRTAARRHGESMARADAETANTHAREMVAISEELRRRGPEAQSELLALLRDDDQSTRFWAASHALGFAPRQAEAVLEAIAAGPPGMARIEAHMALAVWRRGREGRA